MVAKESHALRSIIAKVDNQENVECVVDPGCQIIAMSKAICHDLGIIYDPSVRIRMESVNGGIDESLGIAHNIPLQVSSVTIYIQIYILRSLAYNILLGRPFDILTESVVKNFHDEN